MKRLLTITLAFNLLFLVNASTKPDGETRTATVTRQVSVNDLINIKAKYTELVIETWDKDEIEITATVRYDGKMTDKMTEFLQEFQEQVENKIIDSSGEILIDTDLDRPNKVQIGSKRVGINIGFSEDEFKLDYKIKAPARSSYEISSSYRDVSMIGKFEKVKLTQYSGELTADYIAEADLDMKYGSSNFKEIGKATMEIYEQELEAITIGDLEINTKYSELEIDKITSMEAVSYESDFVIEFIGSLSGNYKYGELEIKENLGDAELAFYEMDIDAKNAGNIKFEQSKYGKIKFDEVKSLNFLQSYEDNLTIGRLGDFRSISSKYAKHNIQTLSGSFMLNAYEDDIRIYQVAESTSEIDIDGKYINAIVDLSPVPFSFYSNVKYGKVDYNESDVDIKKYIKESDQLEVELRSKNASSTSMQVRVKGYEIDVVLK